MNRITRTLMLFVACFLAAQMSAQTSDRSKAHGYQFSEEELTRYPQKTDVPTVYLEVYKTTVVDGKAQPIAEGETPELEDLNTVFGTKNDWYYNAQIIIRDDNGTIEERKEPTTVRGRGNATWDIFGSLKKPLRLKFPQKTALLGPDYATEKSWTLLANYHDATLIRNGMAREIGQKVGLVFCPACKFIDLVVNNTYMGSYQISDQVQVAPKRVPIDEKTGYFLEFNSGKRDGFLEDPYIQTTIGSYTTGPYVNIKSPDPDVETTSGVTTDPKYNNLKVRLNRIITLANNGGYDRPDNWRKYVDMTSAVNAFIAMDISGNYDAVVGNDYFYMNDLSSPIFFGPLWDFDLAWGCKVNGMDFTNKHFWEGEYQPFGQLCKKVFESDPYFVKAVYERWQELYDNGRLTTYLVERMNALKAEVAKSAAKNYASTSEGGAGHSLNKDWADGNNYKTLDDAYSVMETFIRAHIAYLNENYAAKYQELHCDNLPEIAESGLFADADYGGGKQYTYTIKETDLIVNAKLNIELSASNSNFFTFITDADHPWIARTYQQQSFTKTLTVEDVDMLKANGNSFHIIVYDGTCTSVSVLPPDPCDVHSYENCRYSLQDDGTYRRICSVCSTVETKGEPYYLFTVYPESSAMQELYATQWQPDETHPNAIATVTINPGLEAYITGYNIINATKNADKNKVCPDFRLTDGHPFYSDDTFVATTATYSRSVKNDWGTIMLPFDYQPSDANAKSYQLSSMTTNDEGNQLVLTAIQDVVAAYVPVFIKRNAGVETLTITSQNTSVTKSTKKGLTMSATPVEGWTLKGAMEASAIDVRSDEWAGKNVYYISNNKFWHATGKVNISPFRAYLESPALTSSQAIGLMVDDGETTGIMSIENGELIIDSEADAWYSLDGRLLPVRPTSKGIYIHNGRKEVIR